MLVVEAQNVSADGESPEGLARYSVAVRINTRIIWSGSVDHVRSEGAAALLRNIGEAMELDPSGAMGQPATFSPE